MYYFIGIKGSGMASLACILHDLGYDVAGSDIEKFVFTQEHLDSRNIKYYSFDKNNIKDGMNVIIGNSFDESNEEVKAAKSNSNVNTYSYPEFLGNLMKNYISCCVVGTHGKTNTTGLLAHTLAEFDATGYLIGDGTGMMSKNANFFVLEACEYYRRFLNYYPDYAILLNIELDHVDYYKDLDDYVDAFQKFVNNVKKGIAIYGDDEITRNLKVDINCLYYGLNKNNDLYADNIQNLDNGIKFDCYLKNEKIYSFFVPLFGEHLLKNALGVIAICLMNGMPCELIQKGFDSYHGTERRFVIEDFGNKVYIDDYAHHPTAIEAVIKTAKEKYPDHKLVALFKPDRYSRIAYFLDRFNDAFKMADKTFICDFPNNAIKEEGINISINDLVNSINGAELISEDSLGINILNNGITKDSKVVYLFMSSKDIYKFKDLLKENQQSERSIS